MAKSALIFGITGQDGSYLAEFLLEKGYSVFGVKRKSSSFNTGRIDHIYDNDAYKGKFRLLYGDLVDSASVNAIVSEIRPNEIYNLAAQSHVGLSFELPEYTADVVALGTLRILEAIKASGLDTQVKFYQASSSELFGNSAEKPQNEMTPFEPSSPYAVAKQFGYWITKNYRDAFGIFACNGILFNHESPRRGETFVTRKVTMGLAKIALGIQNKLILGNLNALRDWGHARDYVEMQWLMLQQQHPDDYVISSGRQFSVREFINCCAAAMEIKIEFLGTGVDEIGVISDFNDKMYPNLARGQQIIEVNERYFRPSEVHSLLGDYTKAGQNLNWKPKITFEQLCSEMISHDLEQAAIISEQRKKFGQK